MNLLDFELKKSKVEVTSHDETNYGQRSLVQKWTFSVKA